jgi:uncharacterized protein
VEGVTPEGQLRVRVRAAPADGEANRALVGLIADELRVGRMALTLERGASARDKRLRVDGRSAAEVRARWPGVRADGVR